MQIKVLMISSLIWSLLTLMVGCTHDRIAVDLVAYVNQGILSIADLEGISLERYAAVTDKNYISDEAVYKALKNEILPNYRRFLDLLCNINPQTQEVRQLHVLYIRGAEMICSGFKIKKFGLEKKDNVLIRAANLEINKGRIETEKWRRELIALYQLHGVVQKRK